MENKNIFLKVSLSILIVLALFLCAVSLHQMFYEMENNDAKVQQLEEQILGKTEEIEKLEQQLQTYTVDVANDLSSTKEYREWKAACNATEPYDLYDEMTRAYEEFLELYNDGYEGTVLYDATLKLLVPASSRSDLDSYMPILKRYFGVADYHTAIARFVDDLVSAQLLTLDGEYYSWNHNTLSTKNVAAKLNLTTDTANALMGLLRTIGWDVIITK